METQPSETWERVPVHVVEVHKLRIIVVRLSDGVTRSWESTPLAPGWVSSRWDPIVYPGERSLMLFIGWWLRETEGYWMAGAYEFIYTLEVTFEDETFELTKTFIILVTD